MYDFAKLSPNHSGPRTKPIDRLTIHCFVGQVTCERIGKEFEKTSKNASCNYGIGKDGKIILIVDEANRSWCSSNAANDQRAITIECASDSTAPYAFNTAVYQALVDLTVDIMKRNKKHTLVYIPDKAKALKYQPKEGEMLMTFHRWFANKACPGDWFVNKAEEFKNEVNKLLNSEAPISKPKEKVSIPKDEAVYTMPKLGEGLRAIARRSGITFEKIKELNPDIKPPMYLIKIGKQVRIR